MSLDGKRAELAAALSTVAGVTGYAKRPTTIKAGAGWPLFDGYDRGPGIAFAADWRVLLALGGDEQTANDKLDELLPQVTVALDPVAFVQSARPVAIQNSAGEMFGAEIRVRSE